MIVGIKFWGFFLLVWDFYFSVKGVSFEGDVWFLCFNDVEEMFFVSGGWRFCFSMLKILYDKYLDLLGKFLDYVYLVMLFFYECEKYFREIEWMEEVFVDCINGIFL